MRAMSAKAGLVFCLSGISLYGCTALLDLSDNTYLESPASVSAAGSSGSGTGGAGGGSVGTGGSGTGGAMADMIVGIRVQSSDYIVDLKSVASDPNSGDIWLTGSFQGDLSFPNTSPDVVLKGNKTTGGTPDNLETMFWARLDMNGHYLASGKIDSTIGATQGIDIAIDSSGRAVVVGTYLGDASVTIQGKTMPESYFMACAGESDIFALVVGTKNMVTHAYKFGGSGVDKASAVAIGTEMSTKDWIFIAGFYDGDFSFPTLATNFPDALDRDGVIFGISLGSTANTPVSRWAVRLSSNGANRINDVDIHPAYRQLALACSCDINPTLHDIAPPKPPAAAGAHPCAALLDPLNGDILNDMAGSARFAVGSTLAADPGPGYGNGVAFTKTVLNEDITLVGQYHKNLSFGVSVSSSDDTSGFYDGFAARLPTTNNSFTDATAIFDLGGSPSTGNSNEDLVSVINNPFNTMFIGGHLPTSGNLTASGAAINLQINALNAIFVGELRFVEEQKPETRIFTLQGQSSLNRLNRLAWSAKDNSLIAVGNFSNDLNYVEANSAPIIIFPYEEQNYGFMIKIRR